MFSKLYKILEDKYVIASITDLNGVITEVSQSFCDISGYSRDELIGKPHSIVRDKSTKDKVFKEMWKTIKDNGEVWNGIIKNRNKNGNSYYVDTYIEPYYKHHKHVGYMSFRFDVTHKKELEISNRNFLKSIRNFERLFDKVNQGIVIVDSKFSEIHMNHYLHEVLGLEKDKVSDEELFYKHFDKEKIEKYFDDFFRDFKYIDFFEEKEIEDKNGDKLYFEYHYLYFSEDKILITVRDISKEKELIKTTETLVLKSKDAEMGEMLSMIAHQWRQPIATISTILSKIDIKRDLDQYSDDDLTNDVNKISSVILHLSETIDYFRDYARPKSGKKVNLNEVLNSIKTIMVPLCNEKLIKMDFEGEFNDFIVDDRIDQVLLNLYKNSFDAYILTGKRGSITTKASKENDTITIFVSDSAGGIESKTIEKIFEPYFSTKGKNGTGLGLYMTKNIVNEILEGSISCENQNEGVCFKITLPLC